MAFNLGSIVAHVKADITDFTSNLKTAEKQASSFGSHLNGIANVAQKGMAMVGVAAAAAATAALVTGKKAVDLAAEYEQQRIALITLLGDEVKAEEHLALIRKDALKTPYDVSGLITANQLLISAGVQASQAETDILNLGDALAANGKGANELGRIVVNLQQIKNVGMATEMDMKQFAFNGINMYQLLADSTNLPISKLKDMDITYEMVSAALAKASGEGGKYHDANLRQSESLQGLKSNLQDTAEQILINIAKTTGLFEAVKNGTTALTAFITENAPAITAFILTIVEHVRNLATQIISFFNEWIKPALISLTAFFKEHWGFISGVTLGTWNMIKGIIEIAWAIVMGILKVGLAIIAGDWKHAWEAIKETVVSVWEGIKNVLNGALQVLGAWGNAVFGKLVEPFEKAWNKIKDIVDKIKNALDFTQRHSPSVVDIVTTGVNKVNQAMSGLDFGVSLSPTAGSNVGGGFASTAVINISLAGAMIADSYGANQMAEIMGDSIIKRLQNNIRI